VVIWKDQIEVGDLGLARAWNRSSHPRRTHRGSLPDLTGCANTPWSDDRDQCPDRDVSLLLEGNRHSCHARLRDSRHDRGIGID